MRITTFCFVYLTLISTFGFASKLSAEDRFSSFSHGCGTGCVVHVKKIGGTRTIKTQYGQMTTGVFDLYITGGIRGNVRQTTYGFALCSRGLYASNNTQSLTESVTWKEIQGDHRDYMSAFGSFGSYFHSLCNDTD